MDESGYCESFILKSLAMQYASYFMKNGVKRSEALKRGWERARKLVDTEWFKDEVSHCIGAWLLIYSMGGGRYGKR